MRYPGGKNAAGTFQRLINQIPPHAVYIEPFVGSGAVLRMKRPAGHSFAVDRCPGTIADLRDAAPPATTLIEGCGIDFLADYHFSGGEFVYCDPPYLPETCRSRPRYRHVLDRADHERLLRVLLGLPCPAMISGYFSDLYAETLSEWRVVTFAQMTRGGFPAEEWLWMNYPPPLALHDYRYLGEDFREREKFARRRKRWTARLLKMAPLERQALLAALQAVD